MNSFILFSSDGSAEDFLSFMASCLEFLKMPITIYGFTFSLWSAFIFAALASLVIGFVVRLINDE